MEEDLFNTPELLPQEVRDIIEKYEEMDTCYEMCRNLIEELEPHGYTCDYGLDGIPYELQKIKTNKTMKNKTRLKVIEQPYFDRCVFLTYHDEEVVGLNFHQGIGKILYDFATPCPAVTDIFERYSEKNHELSLIERVNKSIELYEESFIFQKENVLLPKAQTKIIKDALNYYLEQFIKFNEIPSNKEEHRIYDLKQLISLMNYDVKIELTSKEKENFSFKNGIDFPMYN
jgi:hypothetical protein